MDVFKSIVTFLSFFSYIFLIYFNPFTAFMTYWVHQAIYTLCTCWTYSLHQQLETFRFNRNPGISNTKWGWHLRLGKQCRAWQLEVFSLSNLATQSFAKWKLIFVCHLVHVTLSSHLNVTWTQFNDPIIKNNNNNNKIQCCLQVKNCWMLTQVQGNTR